MEINYKHPAFARWHLAEKLVRDGLIWSENLTLDPNVSWKGNFQK